MMACRNCGGHEFWFDRTLEPPCYSMHNVCEACAAVQPCGDEKCLYGDVARHAPNPNRINQPWEKIGEGTE